MNIKCSQKIHKNAKYLKIFFLCLFLIIFLTLPLQPHNQNESNIPIMNFIESYTMQYYDDTLKQLGVVWVSVKFVTKFVAIFQHTQISFQPFGIGLSLAPGELLAAINDNLERVSSVLFMLIITILLQKFSLGFITFLVFKILFPCGLFLLLLSHSLKKRYAICDAVGVFIIKFSLLLWISFPLSAFLSHSIYTIYLQDDYKETIKYIQIQNKELESLSDGLGYKITQDIQQQDSQTTESSLKLDIKDTQSVDKNNKFLSKNTNSFFTTPKWLESTMNTTEKFLDEMKNTPKNLTFIKENVINKLQIAINYLDEMIDKVMQVIASFLLTCIVIPITTFVSLYLILRKIV
ncbi:hypothetical protein CQA53_00320 [Helicobacter didelphidarum]|uniref:Uncharacterized protein n=1 Tax=Helicobacter didelphidarum TaxID=2040648 RepID=A0A3D8IQG2_9HELI|nr:hypothetical protein [Helicobacter didelphidarum]RDU67509.1 hypothetical protein CQA53_00320 [Helicobacter didelphidarum]